MPEETEQLIATIHQLKEENARLRADLNMAQQQGESQSGYSAALLEIADISASREGMAAALTRVRDILRRVLHVPHAGIHWRHNVIPPLRRQEVTSGDWLDQHDDPCTGGCIAAVRDILIAIDDVEEDPRVFAHCPLHHKDTSAVLAAPVRIWGHVAGIICCEYEEGRHHWRDEERAFLRQVATELARLYHEAITRDSLATIQQQRDHLQWLIGYTENTHDMRVAELCLHTQKFARQLAEVDDCRIGICCESFMEELDLSALQPFLETGSTRPCYSPCTREKRPVFTKIHYTPRLDTEPDHSRNNQPRKQGMRSRLSLHISHKNLCCGSIHFYSQQAAAFPQDMQSTLQILAQLFANKLNASITLERLRNAEERFQQVSRAASAYTWEINNSGQYRYLTDSCDTVKGRPRSELIGKTPFELMPPEDQKRGIKILKKALRLCQSFHFEHRNILPDGRLSWEEVNGLPLLDKAGNIIGFRGTGVNISERKLQQRAMENLVHALDQAGESVIITDPGGTIEYVNQAFQRVTGYTLDEVRGKNPKILQSGRQDEVFYQKMWKTIGQTGEWQGVLWNKRKNGEIYPERLHIRGIRDIDGRLVNYVGVFSDISEQLSIEEQLRQSQKMEAIGTLVGGVAHNFNNMLAGMIGKAYVARLLVGDCCINARKEVEDIERIGHRAGDMIRKLMAFAHKTVSLKTNVQLAALVNEAVETARLGVPEDILLKTDIRDDSLKSFADTIELQQVIMNMINNARDALRAQQGEKRINVRLKKAKPSARLLRKFPLLRGVSLACLDIIDNGPGVPEELAKRIFDPFFTTKEVGQGTGLGLSMALGTIESHGGAIELRSRPGKCCFSIYLPIQEANEEQSGTKSENEDQTIITNMKGITEGYILVVDDEPVIREMCTELISSTGIQCFEAEDGKQALACLKREGMARCLLLITDMVMPGMSGQTLAKNIWQSDPEFPVLFITGYDKSEVQLQDEQRNYSDVLGKPFDMNEMIIVIRRLMRHPRISER